MLTISILFTTDLVMSAHLIDNGQDLAFTKAKLGY